MALAEALDTVLLSEAEVSCKWPNDILVDGQKIAGILLESQGNGDTVRWIVIGCGVNVASHPETIAYPATNVNAVCGRTVATEQVLEHYLNALFAWRDRWRDDGIEPVRRAWIGRAAGLGGPITVRLPDRELSGRFLDMDMDGALLLELPDGVRQRITAGDVFIGSA